MSAADRHSGRDHRRHLDGRTPWDHRQRPRRPRAVDAVSHDDPRQDRDADIRPSERERGTVCATLYARDGPSDGGGPRTVQPAPTRGRHRERRCGCPLSLARRRVDPRRGRHRPPRKGGRFDRAGHEPCACGRPVRAATERAHGSRVHRHAERPVRGQPPLPRRAARRQPRVRRSPGTETRVHARASCLGRSGGGGQTAGRRGLDHGGLCRRVAGRKSRDRAPGDGDHEDRGHRRWD